MEITLTNGDRSSTAIVPNDSVLYMLSTHSYIVKDDDILTILDFLNGSIGINDIENTYAFVEKIIYYGVIDLEQRIKTLMETTLYSSMPYGGWVYNYLFLDAPIPHNTKYYVNKDKLRGDILYNSPAVKQILMGKSLCQIDSRNYRFYKPHQNYMRICNKKEIMSIAIGDYYLYIPVQIMQDILYDNDDKDEDESNDKDEDESNDYNGDFSHYIRRVSLIDYISDNTDYVLVNQDNYTLYHSLLFTCIEIAVMMEIKYISPSTVIHTPYLPLLDKKMYNDIIIFIFGDKIQQIFQLYLI